MIEHQQDALGQPTPEKLVPLEDVPELKVPENETGVIEPVAHAPLQSFHGDFASFHEGYVRHYIALADTKAAWAFTVASGAIAFLFGRSASKTELLDPQWSVATSLVWSATLCLCASALYSFLVIRPRRQSSSCDSIVFFAQVACRENANLYTSDVANYDQAGLAAARLEHCYDVSQVCASKYASLRLAIWTGLFGVALTLLQLLWV